MESNVDTDESKMKEDRKGKKERKKKGEKLRRGDEEKQPFLRLEPMTVILKTQVCSYWSGVVGSTSTI